MSAASSACYILLESYAWQYANMNQQNVVIIIVSTEAVLFALLLQWYYGFNIVPNKDDTQWNSGALILLYYNFSCVVYFEPL